MLTKVAAEHPGAGEAEAEDAEEHRGLKTHPATERPSRGADGLGSSSKTSIVPLTGRAPRTVRPEVVGHQNQPVR
jgi:hypothetical protein